MCLLVQRPSSFENTQLFSTNAENVPLFALAWRRLRPASSCQEQKTTCMINPCHAKSRDKGLVCLLFPSNVRALLGERRVLQRVVRRRTTAQRKELRPKFRAPRSQLVTVATKERVGEKALALTGSRRSEGLERLTEFIKGQQEVPLPQQTRVGRIDSAELCCLVAH